MLSTLFTKTPAMQAQSPLVHRLLTGIAILVALAMFAAASGDGSADAPSPPPDWVNLAANIVAAGIGVLVLIPRTRVLGAWLAIANMLVSMAANHRFDGSQYFSLVLPFNLTTIALAAILIAGLRKR